MNTSHISNTSQGQNKNIQGILDLVVANDDLLNKFFDITFNNDNQALKLPQVQSGNNSLKTLVSIGTRKYGVLTSDAVNERLKKTSIKEYNGTQGKNKGAKYGGHDLAKAVTEKMRTNSRSFRQSKTLDQQNTISMYSGNEVRDRGKQMNDQRSAYFSDTVTPFPGQQATSSTMMLKYSKPLSKKKQNTQRPGMVIKNGKLLISRKKTVA